MERIRTPKVDNVLLLSRSSSQRSQVGTLHVTDTHIIFVDKEDQSEILILHSLVGNIKKHKGSQRGFPLIIHCKNFQVLQFIVPRESDRSDLYVSLLRLSRPEMYTELYCFSFNPYVDTSERENSWKFLDLKAEYSRMGLPNKLWHVTPINRDYRVCDTYPEELFVPNSVTLPVIVGSSKFRSKGRFPTLSYYCKESHAAICRSSQPLSGFSARCLEDEHMLQAIMKSNPGSRFMYVVDTRPKLNAMANQAAGKGYEKEDNYCNIKFQFFGIENIHVMRSSQQKLIQASALFSSSMGEFLVGVERSDWLKHIRSILDAGIFISKAVREEGVSVLVHCSDGWDRTAQVCSVSSVLLDPYFRTIKGLMVLIEKDWVFFGHKFSHRYNHLNEEHKEASPVIDQFLECVWQIMEQFPCSFEYNERFLVSIHEHVYSCHYGNFICDSPKERQDLCIKEKTYSIWPRFWENKMDFMNPLYKPDQGLLRPSTAPYCFKYWRGLYNQFDLELHPRQSELDCLMVIKEETQKLEAQLVLFEQKQTVLDMEHAKTLYMDKGVFNSKHASDLPDTHQDYSGGFTGAALIAFSSQQEERDSEDQREIFNPKSSNLDCSDQESGVADFSSHDSSGEESLPSEDSVPRLELEKASHKRACKHTI